MGYTHYFHHKNLISDARWQTIRDDIRAILGECIKSRVWIVGPEGKGRTKTVVNDDEISFNGIGKDSHETFTLTREPQDDFCKTARKRYDTAVTACLCYMSSMVAGFHATSDGHGPDFLAGLALAKRALPHLAHRLAVPLDVQRDDRWVYIPSRASIHSRTYQLRFCVDGNAYAFSGGGRNVYQFDDIDSALRWLEHDNAAAFVVSGWTDDKGRRALARAQDKAFRALLSRAAAEGRNVPPPTLCDPLRRLAWDTAEKIS